MTEGIALQRDGGRAMWSGGHLITYKAVGTDTGGAYGLIELLSSPGYAPPPHVHRNEDESVYVVEGELLVTMGDQVIPARAGSFVFMPRGIRHGYHVQGTANARILEIFSPAGFEQFFEEIGEPAKALTLPPPGPLDMEKIMAAARKYQLEIVGPPPAH